MTDQTFPLTQIEKMCNAIDDTLHETSHLFDIYQNMSPEYAHNFESMANITYGFAKEILAFKTFVMPSLKIAAKAYEKSKVIDNTDLVVKLEGDTTAGNA
jgi:hypothetical protein